MTPGWVGDMADESGMPDEYVGRSGPEALRGYSARDAFLWYVCDAWGKFFAGDEQIETVFDHDFGCHVLRRGKWELRLVDTEQFPDQAFGPFEEEDKPKP